LSSPGEASRPAIVVVDDEAEWLALLQRALGRRFGADYDIVVERSAMGALATLHSLREAGSPHLARDDVARPA